MALATTNFTLCEFTFSCADDVTAVRHTNIISRLFLRGGRYYRLRVELFRHDDDCRATSPYFARA